MIHRTAFLLLCFGPLLTGCTAIEYLRGNTPANAVKKVQDPDFPDIRREGINDLMRLGSFARKPPYTTRYGQMARTDPDYLVRATAIRALNQCRDKDSTKIFIAALSDASDMVRLEAAKALNRVPDPDAIQPLRKVVLEPAEKRDVRIAAAEALQHYRRLESARALAGLLNEKDFSIAWQAHQSLSAMTGKDLGYDESAWLNYITGPGKM